MFQVINVINMEDEDKKEISTFTSLVFETSDMKYHGSQKCWIDSTIIKLLNCEIGSYIEVCQPNRSLICCVWPSSDETNSSSIKFEETVYLVNTNTRKYQLRQLSFVKADTVSIVVIVNDYKKFHLWKMSSHVCKDLASKCSKLLRNLCVKEEFCVNLKSLRLSTLYGIKNIVITKFSASIDSEAVMIHSKTNIIIENVQSEAWFQLLQTTFPIDLGGVTSVINQLIDLICLPLLQLDSFRKLNLPRPQGILLRGPPGCGKTSLVKFIACKCKAALVTINGPEVLGSRPGETEDKIKSIFTRANILSLEGPCILFIDELDALCPKRGMNATGVNESRGTSAIISCLDEVQDLESLMVIGATNRPSAIDSALRRPGRFEREILMNVPNKIQRTEILTVLIKHLETSDINIDLLSDLTNGYVGADLKALCNEAAYSAISRRISEQICAIEMCDFHSAMKKVVPSLQKGTEGIVEIKRVDWCDIGGLEDVKKQIKQAVEWPMLHPEVFERFGLPVSKGVMLYGPPGCCKTTLVRAAATATHTTFISLSGAQLFSPFVGESERIVTETFQKARSLAPSILFLDEIDSIVGKRSQSGSHGVQERLLSTLLNEMDGIGVRLDEKMYSSKESKQLEETNSSLSNEVDNSRVLVVAATNRPDLVDAALLRPGRLDQIVYVPPPDYQARLEILKIHSKKIPIVDVDLSSLSYKTEFYTGADLASLCREAAMCAMSESIEASTVTQLHFTTALSIVKPSLNVYLIEKYKQLHFTKGKLKT